MIDDDNLAALREFTLNKSKALLEERFQSLLEIGPPRMSGALNSPIYQMNSSWYFDLKAACEEIGIRYRSLDMDPETSPDILGVLDSESLNVGSGNRAAFERVVCFSVLEHCTNPFIAVQNITKLLCLGGEVLFITPWDFRFHGPRPDCWRISDDGYRSLLKTDYEITCIEYLEQIDRPLSPVAIFCSAKRIN